MTSIELTGKGDVGKPVTTVSLGLEVNVYVYGGNDVIKVTLS